MTPSDPHYVQSPHKLDSSLNQRLNVPMLLCLDFDLTLTHTHLFSYTAEAIRSGFSREDAIMRAIQVIEHQGVRGGERFWDILHLWLSAGHGLAITSFTSFPELPIALLSRGIAQLRKRGAHREVTRWLSRPIIVYGDPAPDLNPPRDLPRTWLISPHPEQLSLDKEMRSANREMISSTLDHSGKNQHISQALKVTNDQGHTFHNAVLMDDDPRNIDVAALRGHVTLAVSRDLDSQEHLSAWENMCLDP